MSSVVRRVRLASETVDRATHEAGGRRSLPAWIRAVCSQRAGSRRRPVGPEPEREDVRLRVSRDEWARYEAAAARAGLPVAVWIRLVIEEEVER